MLWCRIFCQGFEVAPLFLYRAAGSFCVLPCKLIDTLYTMDLMSFAMNHTPDRLIPSIQIGFLAYRNVPDMSCDVRLHVTALLPFQGSHSWKPSAVADTKRLLMSNSVLI